MATLRVIRKAYGKYKRLYCYVKFEAEFKDDFELWCKANLEKLYKEHGKENIEIYY